jgi:hypothetical protein
MELNNTVKISGLPPTFDEKIVFSQFNTEGNLKSWNKGQGFMLIEFATHSDAEAVLCFDDFELTFGGEEATIKVNMAEEADLSSPLKAEDKQETSCFNLVAEAQLSPEQLSRLVFVGNLPNDYDDSKPKSLEGKFNTNGRLEKTFKGKNCYALLFKDISDAKDSLIFDGSDLSEASNAPQITVKALEKQDLALFESFRASMSLSDQDEWVNVPDVDSELRNNPVLQNLPSDSIVDDITKSYPPTGPTEPKKEPQVPETKEEPAKPSIFNGFDEPEDLPEIPPKIEEKKPVIQEISTPVTQVPETKAETTRFEPTKDTREEDTPIDRSQPIVSDRIPRRVKQPESKPSEVKSEEKPEKREPVEAGEPLLEQIKRQAKDFVQFKDTQDILQKGLQVLLVLIFLRAVWVSGLFCK